MDFQELPGIFGQAVMGLMSALDGWIVAVLVLSLFVTAAFRPQQIHDRALFRKSVKLLGLYLVVPIALGTLLLFDMHGKAAQIVSQIILLAGRVLLAASIVQALRSLVPEHAPQS